MSTPFCECAVCAFIHERDPRHVIREASRVVTFVLDNDEIAGMALCMEHRLARLRIYENREEPEHVTH